MVANKRIGGRPQSAQKSNTAQENQSVEGDTREADMAMVLEILFLSTGTNFFPKCALVPPTSLCLRSSRVNGSPMGTQSIYGRWTFSVSLHQRFVLEMKPIESQKRSFLFCACC